MLAAEYDLITPVSDSALIAKALPAAEFVVVVPGAGHAVMLERPDAVNACLENMLDLDGSGSRPGRSIAR